MKKTILLIGVFLFLAAVAVGGEPKYVFLFIGDGMAFPQRMAAEEFSRYSGKGGLAINKFPYHAVTRTASSSSLTTDSAAAATAIACGVKTYNGAVGLNAKGEKVVSVAEYAKSKGKKVGIITTVTLNHATPAGFYGHRAGRTMYFELGLDLVASGFDFFGGGGIEYYRKNGVDIFKEAAGKGYTVLNGKSDLDSLRPGQKTIFLADAKDKKMSYAIDADPEVPTLAEITAGGIKVLDNPEGFFMMVEGGLIDYAGHGNDAAINVYEVLAFDEAVKVALDFYHKHPEETLIIVTGDHETGGMTLGCVSSTLNVKYFAHQKCSSAKVGSLVAEARKNDPEFDFEKAKSMLTEYCGFKFDNGAGHIKLDSKDVASLKEAFDKNELHHTIRIIINKKSGIGWTTYGHTALPVLTTAIGCKAEIFQGYIENTDISLKLKDIL
ncbi:MAG: alkaline phosphatase [Lentisphaeria bacterium]|nr:alkaline phosphatase [Lentisphaeria bacterium]